MIPEVVRTDMAQISDCDSALPNSEAAASAVRVPPRCQPIGWTKITDVSDCCNLGMTLTTQAVLPD